MLQGLKSYIQDQKLISPQDPILLGVSGGIDSMVLLHLLMQHGVSLSIAHCNFGLRGEESDADEMFVRDVTKSNGIELFVQSFDTMNYAKQHGLSVQMAARELRYSWFKELCETKGFMAVAVAHNADDLVETMLINLTRSTGLKGLTGIKPRANGVIRPLLFASREEIEEYAKEQGVSFREDSSNAQEKYARNRIRLNVLPQLARINPSVRQSLINTSNHLSLAWELVSGELASFRTRATAMVGKELHYSLSELKSYPHNRLLLAEELIPLGFPSDSIDGIANALTSQPGKVFYSPSHVLLVDREFLILSPREEEGLGSFLISTTTERVDSPICLTFEHSNSKSFSNNQNVAVIDSEKITWPLVLRPWAPGDSFVPLGMKGRKKISDILIDLKVPRHRKGRVMVLESSGQVVWIIGLRISDIFKITPNTSTTLRITYHPQD